ncbi:hypothetical protein PLICRDRAFT_171494 [Plicaturopsis crispa FD-325 SS-3]|nr:hypothetical protein PLICRDRAFT_171494 [Plicaturopsis crispa FD-325 SS-3]
MQGMQSQNQWSQPLMPQNLGFPNGMHAHNANNMHWTQQQQNVQNNGNIPGMNNGAQYPQQNMQGGLAALGAYAAMLPPQIVQDALRLSAPVGTHPNDDELLVRVLRESALKGQTYRQAIEQLHAVNNHGANMWKDYYLDHKPRIDGLVESMPGKTAKKPTPRGARPPIPASSSSRGRSTSHASDSRRASTSSHKAVKRRGPAIVPKHEKKPTQRKTINSLTTHVPNQTDNLLPPHAFIKVPKPPSRSPTPPTEVVPGQRGNRYTQGDRDFFIRFISYELKKDASLTKADLCEKLFQKAPHHTAVSWSSHWHSRHDIADKILAAAKADVDDAQYSYEESESEHSSDEDAEGEPESSVHGHESDHQSESASRSESESDGDDDGSEYIANGDGSDQDNLQSDSENDEDNMGSAGEPFNNADMRIVAKHIASVPNWGSRNNRERWGDFGARYSSRSTKSWVEYYRRYEKAIDQLVRRYRKRQRVQSTPSVPPQRGRPTWAQKDSASTTPKRRLADEDGDGDEEDSPGPKRFRS